jgi:hypothetical protein
MVILAVAMGWFGDRCTMGSWCGDSPAAQADPHRCCNGETPSDSQSGSDHSKTSTMACCFGIAVIHATVEPVTISLAVERVEIMNAQHDSLATEPSTPPPRLSV